MRALKALPHTSTKETANYLMLGRELRLSDELYGHTPPLPEQSTYDYILDRDDLLRRAHDALRGQQKWVIGLGQEEALLYQVGDQVRFLNKWRRKGENTKLQPKYVGPYRIASALPDDT